MENFVEGLKFPWKRPVALLNILWIFIPILGMFALMGYVRKIVLELSKGNKSELPKFGNFWDNLGVGFKLFVYFIPTLIVLILIDIIPVIGPIISLLISLSLLPWLIINLYIKNEFSAVWEIKEAFEAIKNNIMDYLIALLKTIGFVIIYGIASIILIGIPAYMFGSMYYLVDFYKKK